MWWKRVATAGLITAASLALATTAAGAATPTFGSPTTLIAAADPDVSTTIAADGTVRGFADSANALTDQPIGYFRNRAGTVSTRTSPYRGHVIATAWDGVDALYVVYSQGNVLKIARHLDSSGVFSPATVLSAHYYFNGADVVASAGKWWVVWSEAEGGHATLFQRHTLLGSGERTHAVTTPAASSDLDPSLAYEAGHATLAWTRVPKNNGSPSKVWLGRGTGALFSANAFATGGNVNYNPDVAVSAGHTYVTWSGLDTVSEKDNATGPWTAHQFATHGHRQTIAVSLGRVFVGWTIGRRR